MTVGELVAVYLLIGVGCGAAVLWRAPAPRLRFVPSAAATVVVWPLWVPFALASEGAGDEMERAQTDLQAFTGPLASRLAQALGELRRAQAQSLLTEAEVSAIEVAAVRALRRQQALEQQLSSRADERRRLEERIAEQRSNDPAAAELDTALRHRATLERLAQLQHSEAKALVELANVLELMNAQLALASFGSSTSLDALRAELRDRVDALQEAEQLGADLASPVEPTASSRNASRSPENADGCSRNGACPPG